VMLLTVMDILLNFETKNTVLEVLKNRVQPNLMINLI